MDINKQIIDQRIRRIAEENSDWFQNLNEAGKLSRTFLLLGVQTYLQIDLSEAETCLTDGSGDLGIDAIYIGDTFESDFYVFLFQAKYNLDLEKDKNFPENSVLILINAVGQIFNPSANFSSNKRLESKINEIRSYLVDGYIPRIKWICLSNGLRWVKQVDEHIKNANFLKDQVEFEYLNHNNIIQLQQLQTKKEINDSIKLVGKAIVEEFSYKRVL